MPTVARGVDVQHLDPQFSQRLDAMIAEAEAEGYGVAINSGYRTYGQQQALYSSGNGGVPVARPGTSPHEFGVAADLGGDQGTINRLHELAPQFGLAFDVANDPVHVELPGTPHSSLTGQGTPAPPQQAAGPNQNGSMPLIDRFKAVTDLINGVSTPKAGGDTPSPGGATPDPGGELPVAGEHGAEGDTKGAAPGPVQATPEGGSVPQSQKGPTATGAYAGYINQAAQKYGVDPALISAIIDAESGGNSQAVSRTGAQGLMQLEPGTAQSHGVKNVFDPQQNIEGGTAFFSELLQRYGGDVRHALAAYNAGPGNVNAKDDIPSYTQGYVTGIMSRARY